MKYLDAGTGTRVNKIFKGWDDIMKEFGFSQSSASMVLLHLAEALAKRWERRQILMLVDEIFDKEMLSNLGNQTFPESVRMVLVLNPILTQK